MSSETAGACLPYSLSHCFAIWGKRGGSTPNLLMKLPQKGGRGGKLLKTKRVQKQKGFKAKKLKLPKSLCNGDFRFVGILAFGRVLRWDLLVVKAHGVYLRRAYFQEHRPKRGGVVPFCSFQL